MNKVIQNILCFIAFCLVGYIVFKNMDEINGMVREGYAAPPEGRTRHTNAELAHKSPQQAPQQAQQSQAAAAASAKAPGIAGNAATYAATLKAQFIQLQDTFLISKYRSDYENVIINMSDLANTLMLNTVLSANATQPQNIIETLKTLSALNGAQAALNNVMKFIDAN